MTKNSKMSALERVLTVLEGKIPDRVPSFILGGDCDFVDRFMKSPYKLTEEDMKQLDSDRVSYMIPFIHSIVAKFSPPDIFPGGIDAKIDMCWSTTGGGLIKMDFTDRVINNNGGTFDAVIKEDGIPHLWYTGPALLKREHIQEYWKKEKELKPNPTVFRNLSRIRKTMLEKYDTVVSQGITGPFENCVFGIGHANFTRFARKDPKFLQQHIDFQWETIEKPSLKLLMNQKPDVVMCGDDYGFNRGLQINAIHWRKYIKPKLAEYVKITHDGGAKFVLHSCGNIGQIFPDFVEIGIDGVESLKPKCNDLKMYREKYPEITLIGTIDDSEMLIYESPEYIRNSVKKSINKLGKKGGYIPGPTNFLLDQPPENIVSLYKAIQDFGSIY
ncbi:MAG: uroporphyrinogen decarboxylase family protein [Promethearchaeota archaeon]|jgi:uroporphyrinogen-III decarboxylase